MCGTDREIIAGDYGEAPPGARAAGPRPRVAGPGARATRAARSTRATSSPASSAVPTRCRAPTARPASGTCAATAGTPSTASRGCTGSPASGGGSARVRRTARPRSRGPSACCWSRPASWRRRGSTSSGSARAAAWMPGTVLVTGAGPIGLLAAPARRPARARRSTCWTGSTDGPKPELVRAARRDLPHRCRAGPRLRRRTWCSSAPARRRWSSA